MPFFVFNVRNAFPEGKITGSGAPKYLTNYLLHL